jgi:hypothetical protein
MFNGLNALEKLAHAYQLLEIWERAGQVYRRLRANPPAEARQACSCLDGGARPAVLEQLTKMAAAVRKPPGRNCR